MWAAVPPGADLPRKSSPGRRLRMTPRAREWFAMGMRDQDMCDRLTTEPHVARAPRYALDRARVQDRMRRRDAPDDELSATLEREWAGL